MMPSIQDDFPPWNEPLHPPRDEGCKHNGFGDPALHASNGSQPTPSPHFSLKDHMACANLLCTKWQDAMDANFARLDASVE
jgi:hypothetical protein